MKIINNIKLFLILIKNQYFLFKFYKYYIFILLYLLDYYYNIKLIIIIY